MTPRSGIYGDLHGDGREVEPPAPVAKCPFVDPRHYQDTDEPCPVCGALGEDEDVSAKCVDR